MRDTTINSIPIKAAIAISCPMTEPPSSKNQHVYISNISIVQPIWRMSAHARSGRAGNGLDRFQAAHPLTIRFVIYQNIFDARKLYHTHFFSLTRPKKNWSKIGWKLVDLLHTRGRNPRSTNQCMRGNWSAPIWNSWMVPLIRAGGLPGWQPPRPILVSTCVPALPTVGVGPSKILTTHRGNRLFHACPENYYHTQFLVSAFSCPWVRASKIVTKHRKEPTHAWAAENICHTQGWISTSAAPHLSLEGVLLARIHPGTALALEQWVRELQGRWPGLHWVRCEVGGRSSIAALGPYGRLRELRCAGWRENTQQGTLADRGGESLRRRWVSCRLAIRPGVESLAAVPGRGSTGFPRANAVADAK